MKRYSLVWAVYVILRGTVLLAEAGPAAVPGVPAPVRLNDSTGHAVEPLADRGQAATLVFFLTTECPVANAYAPEISRIVARYQKKGVVAYGVYAQESPAAVTRHLSDFVLPLKALMDPERELAKLTGATVTPEACVLSASGKVLYRGRIDDRVVKFGTVRPEPRVRDLRLALDAVLAGKPVPEKFTKAIGCYIFPGAAPK